jgi:hypothetical protein
MNYQTKALKMKKIKLTKEQYDKLVKLNLIQENNVDKLFKTSLSKTKVHDLKYMPEEKITLGSKFNIKKPLPNIKNNLNEELNKLLEYIYGLNEEFSPFWENNNLSYDDICEILESKGYLVKKENTYKVSKKLGDVKTVKEQMLNTLNEIVGNIEEDSNVPFGADFDSNAPWRTEDPHISKGEKSKDKFINVKYKNPEIAILSDINTGDLFVFYHADLDSNVLANYATRHGFPDADGDIEYQDDFDIDEEVLENYINDNFQKISKGSGLQDFESGKVDMVKIDDEVKQELLELYDKDSELVLVLNPIAEATGAASAGAYVGLFSPSNETPKEYDGDDLPPVVAETSAASAGSYQYDANALPGINRDGSFKSTSKTKAQKNTQWAGGSFVELDNCTKLNNNKSAQNGKCSTGAVDNVVKLKQTKSNINAPSLSESKTYSIYKLDRLVKKK